MRGGETLKCSLSIHFYAHFIYLLKFIMMIDNANNNKKTKKNVKIIESNEIEKYLDTHRKLLFFL
jgi:hypothetical protein